MQIFRSVLLSMHALLCNLNIFHKVRKYKKNVERDGRYQNDGHYPHDKEHNVLSFPSQRYDSAYFRLSLGNESN